MVCSLNCLNSTTRKPNTLLYKHFLFHLLCSELGPGSELGSGSEKGPDSCMNTIYRVPALCQDLCFYTRIISKKGTFVICVGPKNSLFCCFLIFLLKTLNCQLLKNKLLLLLHPKPKKTLCYPTTWEESRNLSSYSALETETAGVPGLLSEPTVSSVCYEHVALWVHTWNMDRKMRQSQTQNFSPWVLSVKNTLKVSNLLLPSSQMNFNYCFI